MVGPGGCRWTALGQGVPGQLASPRVGDGLLPLAGFGLVNPWFEEAYWRGLLIDATADWVAGLGVVYSTLLFAWSHHLIWGVNSVALRHPAVVVGLAFVGAVWGVAYYRTRSLRFTIAGHAAANLLGLSVPVLMNLHVPAALR
jgi:membrane protease YdiL (CAAX protease family)